MEAALAEALGPEAALSKSTVSRVCAEIKGQFEAWQQRRLDYHANAAAEPVLAAWGITTEGKPVFVGLDAAAAESSDAWEGFLTDLGEHGLRCPLLVISDGAAGLLAAIERTMPAALRQRCLVHRAQERPGQDPQERPG